jgi:hypothetical protein
MYNLKNLKPIHFLKKIFIYFLNLETDPRLQYIKSTLHV